MTRIGLAGATALMLAALLPCRAPAAPEKESVSLRELTEKVAPSLVRVHFYFQEDPDRPPEDWSSRYSRQRYEYLIDNKQSLDVPGAVIDSGQVLVSDFNLDEDHLQRIELSTAAGDIIPATVEAILHESPALLLAFDSEAHDLPPLVFEENTELEFGDSVAAVQLVQSGQEWQITPAGFAPQAGYGEPEACARCYRRGGGGSSLQDTWFSSMSLDTGPAPAVIADASGRLLGVVTGARFDLDQVFVTWKGAELKESPRTFWPDYRQLKKELEDHYKKRFDQFALEFRQDGNSSSMNPYMMWGSEGIQSEEFVYGLPLSATRWLVPQSLSRTRVKGLDSVEWREDSGERSVRFAGAFEDYGMFLLEAEVESASPARAGVVEPATWPGEFPPPFIRPYLTLHLERRFGREYAEIGYCRNDGWTRGYENELTLSPERELEEGTFILDLEGKLAGLSVRARHKEQEQKEFEEDSSYSSYSSLYGGNSRKLMPLNDLSELFRNPSEHFDPNIRQMSREEAKRRVWLGVEFSRMTPDLARFLKVEKPTRSGSLGMIINTVYPNSPAEELGIQVGDILLTIQSETQQSPTDLTPSERYDSGFYGHFEDIRTSDMDLGYNWSGPPPWRARSNYLTELLAAFGEGEVVELSWWSNGRTRTVDFEVVQAPVDFESAPKVKDDLLGVTVKDLTYEVRNALQLPAEKGGVVVSKVESGSPMAVADVGTHQLILEIDGRDIRDVEDFEKRIDALREQGEETARLTVWSLGKTRFADLSLAPGEILRTQFDMQGPPDASF